MDKDLKKCLEILEPFGADTVAPWDLDTERWGVNIENVNNSGVCCTENGEFGAFWNDGERYEYFENVEDACKWLIEQMEASK